jgi:S1-C subfamily serine protease
MRGADVLAVSSQLADAVERAARWTVRVMGRPGPAASGVALTADLVVTADHAVEADHELRVGLPCGLVVGATLVGRDPTSDLAVLRLAEAQLEAAEANDAEPRVGSLAVAVARPGAGPSASLAFVSGVDGPFRTYRGGVLERAIHVDAVMYPGFSGGCLVDPTGAVLGMTTSALPMGGPGLAVPWSLVTRFAEAIVRDGRVQRGYLGIACQSVELSPPARALAEGQERGLLVTQVVEDGPAAQAGFLQGDLLIGLDNRPVPGAGVEGDVLYQAPPFRAQLRHSGGPPPGPGPHFFFHERVPPPPGPLMPPPFGQRAWIGAAGMPLPGAPIPPPFPPPPGTFVHWEQDLGGEADDLQAFLGPDRVGSTLNARVIRGGEVRELSVAVAPRP